jgi:large repetitive protein
MFSRRRLIIVTALLALVLVPGAHGEQINGYTATGSPSHVKPLTLSSYAIVLTNTSLDRSAEAASVGIPAGFVVLPTVQATASCAGVSSTWTVEVPVPSVDGKIKVRRSGGSTNNLCPGGTLTIVFSATSSAVEGTYVWATELLRGEDTFVLNGAQPSVIVDGTPPMVTIQSHPADPTNDQSPTFAFFANEAASFQCQLDGGGFTSCGSPITYGDRDDGSHTFVVRATDTAGNTGETSHAWTIDTDPPTVTIGQKPNSFSNVNSPTFAFSAKEATNVQCKLDDDAFSDCTSPVSYTELRDGPHTFTVRATDTAGNIGQSSHAWTIDTIAPTVAITKKPNNPSGVSSAVFEFAASEAATFQCSLDAGAFAGCTSPRTYTNLTDRVHTFKVKATDTAGNASEAETYDWLVETDLPVVTLTEKPTDPTSSAAASFAFTVNKNSTLECKLDDGAYAKCQFQISQTQGAQTYTHLADGRHIFRVKATSTGGVGPETVYAWTIDTTGPATALTEKPGDPTNSRSASFTFNASEPATFQCMLDGAVAACSSPQTYGNLAEGRHTFVVRATDGLNNVGPDTTYLWTIETRAPVLTITSGPPSLGNNRSASVSFSADEPATFQCSLDDRGFEPCSSPAAYAGLPEGDHSFTLRATDAAGNVAGASRAWTIDATPPQTTLASRPKAKTATRSATFAFSANEPGSFQCRLDAGSYAPCKSPTTYTRLKRGVHRFMVRAIDAAGNVDAVPAVAQWRIGRNAAVSALFAPAAGARVTRPPLLRWRAVPRASYYNVQLYKAGRKVLTAWPRRTRLQLQMRWRFNGRAERFGPGLYRWYVWPAFNRRFGKLVGTSTFVVVRRQG